MRTTARSHYYYYYYWYDRQPVCDDENVRATGLAFIIIDATMLVNRHTPPSPRRPTDFAPSPIFARTTQVVRTFYSFPGARFRLGELTGFEIPNDISRPVDYCSYQKQTRLEWRFQFTYSRRTWSNLKRGNVLRNYIYSAFNIRTRCIIKIVKSCE